MQEKKVKRLVVPGFLRKKRNGMSHTGRLSHVQRFLQNGRFAPPCGSPSKFMQKGLPSGAGAIW
jgi:hypothetical protein